ncbi:leucine-rich repeat protein kinase family protein [Artemisia annua]|uniref:Leucine-rich repeat protein kinase family protein n=1 Tax=Artemisia annua TaxID=35608 RepID=A0A2U1MZM6_ARTAN|nr:leucine-rich repeat protein kinase family protein [Artemisia annua]
MSDLRLETLMQEIEILAINSLYAALGYPPLPGWLVAGGDPCAEGWQGVQCVNSNITGIILNGANLGGELGENLGTFASIIQIDLGNNHIGGPIPSNLPLTIKILTLSGNQLTGTIPDSISLLGQMTDFNLNNNHLTGVIPDSFQQLTPLTTMDLSANNLSGPLPPSMARLSSMTTLHLQDNHLTGLLDVLQDLPLIALDVGNNLFSGPIPPRLLTMPNFRSAGNPFNTTIIPSPPLSSPSPSSIGALPPDIGPGIQVFGHSPPEPLHSSGNKSLVKNKLVWVGMGGFLFLVVLASGLCFFMSKRRKEKSTGKVSKDGKAKNFVLNISTPTEHRENDTKNKDTLAGSSTKGEKIEMISKKSKNKEDHVIDMTKVNASSFPTPLLPPQPSPLERVVVKPLVAPPTTSRRTLKKVDSIKFFSIASLQEYTDSFSQENLVGSGMLATVYKAELPNGKQLAIKKLDDATSQKWNEERFIELVSNVSKLRNENIVALEGYCLEHGQRLFVYEYCENGTLHEALHLNDEMHEKLSWNSRVHVALQIAKALEYLHEVCQPPVVHHNLKSTNILFDNELNARVSDCGLAPLLPSSNISQLQSSGYGAPELELGSYTYQSDVYSFGVIMLELITGRKAFDSSKPRGEQYLVRWANSRLHDIEELSGMVDPSIRAAISSKALSRFADIISLCVQPEPEFRPPMSEIVQSLLHMIQRNL